MNSRARQFSHSAFRPARGLLQIRSLRRAKGTFIGNDGYPLFSLQGTIIGAWYANERKPVALSALELPRKRIADFCRRHYVRKLALFGSILRPDFRPDSDIDVLVEFERGHVPGLAFFTMEEELSTLLGRKVDPNTPAGLSPYFRDEVLHEAVTLYGPA